MAAYLQCDRCGDDSDKYIAFILYDCSECRKKKYVEVVWNGLILIRKIKNPFVLNVTIKKKYVVNVAQTTNAMTNIFVYINVVNAMNTTFATSVLIGLMKTEEIQSVVYAMKNIYRNKEKNVLFNKKNALNS